SGEFPRKSGSGQVGIVPYRAYQTQDVELVVAAGNDGLFRSLCQVLQHPQWADDPRFASNPDRVQHGSVLYALIEAEMLKRTGAEWIELLEAAGIPCAPVQNVQQMLESPQIKALGILQPVPGASVPMIVTPISFDGQRKPCESAAPALGAHTHEVFPSTEVRA
ncbi:MAG TPA: CoA transferase, partial [Burkholderiaceae bacterium]